MSWMDEIVSKIKELTPLVNNDTIKRAEAKNPFCNLVIYKVPSANPKKYTVRIDLQFGGD